MDNKESIDLKQFLLKTMRMSGPYQPAIIKKLLQNNGAANLESIAADLSHRDPDNIRYFLKTLKLIPKTVLNSHHIAELKDGKYQFFPEVEFDPKEKDELIKICDQKLNDFYEKYEGETDNNNGWGRKRVMLIEKHPYCSTCGGKPPKVMLDIDHIKPVSKGGSDELENLQVLCHRCNRGKGNYLMFASDHIHLKALQKDSNCVFCNLPVKDLVFENEYVQSFRDRYPITEGHTLIIPKRHIASALELTSQEMLWTFETAKQQSQQLQKEDESISGFNMGFNIGQDAGQSVMHVHFHLIPRRKGDHADPFGGIRNIIPGKGRY